MVHTGLARLDVRGRLLLQQSMLCIQAAASKAQVAAAAARAAHAAACTAKAEAEKAGEEAKQASASARSAKSQMLLDKAAAAKAAVQKTEGEEDRKAALAKVDEMRKQLAAALEAGRAVSEARVVGAAAPATAAEEQPEAGETIVEVIECDSSTDGNDGVAPGQGGEDVGKGAGSAADGEDVLSVTECASSDEENDEDGADLTAQAGPGPSMTAQQSLLSRPDIAAGVQKLRKYYATSNKREKQHRERSLDRTTEVLRVALAGTPLQLQDYQSLMGRLDVLWRNAARLQAVNMRVLYAPHRRSQSLLPTDLVALDQPILDQLHLWLQILSLCR